MRPFGIVVPEVFRNLLLPESEILGNPLDAFILDGTVEAFNMGIVIRRSYPRVPMAQSSFQYSLGEPF